MTDPAAEHACSNCGASLQGPYCHRCGQDRKNYIRSLLGLVPELLGELSNWDNRLWRTLWPLWLRPGHLSLRYVGGHRAPYVPPLRLYIFTSIIAFLVFSLALPYAPPNTVETNAVDIFQAPTPSMHLPFVSDALNEQLNQKLARLIANPELGISRFFSLAPQVMFLLLPVFALLLTLLYVRQRRFYIEHLILALHSHSFLLQVAILMIGIIKLQGLIEQWPWIASLLGVTLTPLLWTVPIYLLVSQKVFYRQSWPKTLFKFGVTALCYSMMFLSALLSTIVISVLRS